MSESIIQVESGKAKLHSLGEYYPYRIKGEINPKFNKHSGFILSSKNRNNRDFLKSVVYFSKLMQELTRTWHIQPISIPGPRISIVVVPSSSPGQVSPGLTEVMKNLCKLDSRFTFTDNVLVRTTAIEKLATGGNRSVHIHKSSIKVDTDKLDTPYVMLVDDVLTTGNSFVACHDIIKNKSPQHTLFGVVLGKTAYE